MKLKEKEEYFGWRPMEYNSMKCSNKEEITFLSLIFLIWKRTRSYQEISKNLILSSFKLNYG